MLIPARRFLQKMYETRDLLAYFISEAMRSLKVEGPLYDYHVVLALKGGAERYRDHVTSQDFNRKSLGLEGRLNLIRLRCNPTLPAEDIKDMILRDFENSQHQPAFKSSSFEEQYYCPFQQRHLMLLMSQSSDTRDSFTYRDCAITAGCAYLDLLIVYPGLRATSKFTSRTIPYIDTNETLGPLRGVDAENLVTTLDIKTLLQTPPAETTLNEHDWSQGNVRANFLPRYQSTSVTDTRITHKLAITKAYTNSKPQEWYNLGCLLSEAPEYSGLLQQIHPPNQIGWIKAAAYQRSSQPALTNRIRLLRRCTTVYTTHPPTQPNPIDTFPAREWSDDSPPLSHRESDRYTESTTHETHSQSQGVEPLPAGERMGREPRSPLRESSPNLPLPDHLSQGPCPGVENEPPGRVFTIEERPARPGFSWFSKMEPTTETVTTEDTDPDPPDLPDLVEHPSLGDQKVKYLGVEAMRNMGVAAYWDGEGGRVRREYESCTGLPFPPHGELQPKDPEPREDRTEQGQKRGHEGEQSGSVKQPGTGAFRSTTEPDS